METQTNTEQPTTPIAPMQRAMDALNKEPVKEVPKEEIKETAVGAVTDPESAPAEPVKEAKPDFKKFVDLAKKERKFLERKKQADSEIKLKEQELVSKKESIRQEAILELKDLLKSNPNAALEKLESSYNKITEYNLSDGKQTPESVSKDLMTEIESLKKTLGDQRQEFDQREKQRTEQENQRIIKSFNENVINTAKANPEKWELVNIFEQTHVVPHIIEQYFIQTQEKDADGNVTKAGKILSIDEACDILEKDIRKQAEKLLKTKFFAEASKPSSPQEVKKEEPKATSLNKPKPTITNDLTSSAPSLLPPKTEEDRMKRALAKLA